MRENKKIHLVNYASKTKILSHSIAPTPNRNFPINPNHNLQ